MDRTLPTRTRTLGAAALALAAALAGCSMPRTWPSASGSQGISADTPPLPQVVISALRYAHDEIAKDSPLVYNLPAEINVAAWPTFERGLAPAKAMCPGDTHVWTVRQARIDGGKAQVDIEFPSRDGFYQTVTVHLAGGTAGLEYKPAFLQYWKVPVKDPVCQQPVEVVERLCGPAAAERLRAERAPAAAKPEPPRGTPSASAEEPSK